MMVQCVQELKEIGYTVGDIRSISFSRGRKTALAYCRGDKDYHYNPYKCEYENPAFHIRVHGAFRDLDESYRDDMKALVMHEVIHAVDCPYYRKMMHNLVGIPDHGPEYIKIKNDVERVYGYRDIHDPELKNDTRLHKYLDIYYGEQRR